MSDNNRIYRSFWADDPSDEKVMWVKCLDTLALIDQLKLIHYGSYETQFLRRMKARYCSAPMNAELIDYMISSSVNLLSFTYAQIYFPTYSNTLKEVARFLGFEWSERDPSGLRALMWRSEWENSRDSGIKQELTIYNAEDCAAVQKVADAIARVCDEQRTTDAAVDSIVLSDGVLLAHELSLFGVSVPSRSRIVVDPGGSVNSHLPVLRFSEKEPDRIRKVLRSEH